MPKTSPFPQTLCVTSDTEGAEHYLIPHEDGVDSIDQDGRVVAVYELKRVTKARVTRTLAD